MVTRPLVSIPAFSSNVKTSSFMIAIYPISKTTNITEKITVSRIAVSFLNFAINFKSQPNAKAITIAIIPILLNAVRKQNTVSPSKIKNTISFFGFKSIYMRYAPRQNASS